MSLWPCPRIRARLTASAVLTTCLTALATQPLAHGDHGGGGGSVLPAGVTVVTAAVDYSSFQPISDARLTDLAGQGVEGVHSLRSITVPSISIGYGITSDLTVGMRLPYLANREIRETNVDEASFDRRGGVYGFGDTTVTATWRFLREGNAGLDAMLIAGVKVPTGRTDAVDKLGTQFETEHQPGSGSWDGLFGLAVSKQVGVIGLNANVLYTVGGDGDRDTNLGDKFSYGVGVSYRLWSGGGLATGPHMHLGASPEGIMYHGGHDHSAPVPQSTGGPLAVSLTLGLNGEWAERVRIGDVREDNTGGHVLYFSPGLKVESDKTAAAVTFGIPIETRLNGIQSEPDWRLSSSFGVKF